MATATAETTTFGSGKTLFGLTIDPDCFSADRSQPPTTLQWDAEGSADTFTDLLETDREAAEEYLRISVFNNNHGR